jgi:hypothetical protein
MSDAHIAVYGNIDSYEAHARVGFLKILRGGLIMRTIFDLKRENVICFEVSAVYMDRNTYRARNKG